MSVRSGLACKSPASFFLIPFIVSRIKSYNSKTLLIKKKPLYKMLGMHLNLFHEDYNLLVINLFYLACDIMKEEEMDNSEKNIHVL